VFRTEYLLLWERPNFQSAGHTDEETRNDLPPRSPTASRSGNGRPSPVTSLSTCRVERGLNDPEAFGAGLRRHRFGFKCTQPYRLTARTPLARHGFEHSVAARTALGATAV
jgi:hypothetical protein